MLTKGIWESHEPSKEIRGIVWQKKLILTTVDNQLAWAL